MKNATKKLGETNLKRPIYFFLGNFADGKDPSRPNSLVMPLEAFPPEVLTFTYPDSIASLPIAKRKDHVVNRKAYHGSVFSLAEIQAVLAQFGLPKNSWRHDPKMTCNRFIKVQFWTMHQSQNFLTEIERTPGEAHDISCSPFFLPMLD